MNVTSGKRRISSVRKQKKKKCFNKHKRILNGGDNDEAFHYLRCLINLSQKIKKN